MEESYNCMDTAYGSGKTHPQNSLEQSPCMVIMVKNHLERIDGYQLALVLVYHGPVSEKPIFLGIVSHRSFHDSQCITWNMKNMEFKMTPP